MVFIVRCERCGTNLQENQATSVQGKVLCEDCTFDLLNPPKACDLLAVSSTLSIRKQLGQTGTEGLSEQQRQIYNVIVERGRISREELTALLKITPHELERQIATLRHCELIRAFKEGSTVYLTKF
jgi:hypothetical protein